MKFEFIAQLDAFALPTTVSSLRSCSVFVHTDLTFVEVWAIGSRYVNPYRTALEARHLMVTESGNGGGGQAASGPLAGQG